MKLLLVVAATAVTGVRADPPVHTVYNCDKIRQNVDKANAMIGDGKCDHEVNCGPYSYDLGDCWDSKGDICTSGTDWYTTGRENFRCSTKTGGIRLGRTDWVDACTCYQDCEAIATKKNATLTAFDMYSGKCRCWSGTCDSSDTGSLPCFDGGDQYGVGSSKRGAESPDAGNNWRCPAQIYFVEKKYDCDGRDITFEYANTWQYIGDGFCDDASSMSQQTAFAQTAATSFNFNCKAHNWDGGDCELDCHESIYWATNFVDLGQAFEQIDDCGVTAPVIRKEWTSACDCYSFCSGLTLDTSEDFLFDHDQNDMCRCWFNENGEWGDSINLAATSGRTTFCGLNSQCQIYQPNRQLDCRSNDFTLGVCNGDQPCFSDDNLGNSVESYSEYISSQCVQDAMCYDNSYSMGQCFDCNRISTQKIADSYCANDVPLFTISLTALQEAVDENALIDTTGSGNCDCVNFCFSMIAETDEVEFVYDIFANIAGDDFAYAIRNGTCACYEQCSSTTLCGTTAGDCPNGGDTVYYSSVADLNAQE